jgi:hypothetical protein
MSHRLHIAFAVTALLAAPATAIADTSGGAAAPVAQAAASPPSSSPAPSSPGRERTGIVDVSSKAHRHAASKPVAKPKPAAVAPAPVSVPRFTPRVAGTDGLPYTGGSPILGALCGVGFLMLGVGVRLRYGFAFRLAPR